MWVTVALALLLSACSTERPAAGPPAVPDDPLGFVVIGGSLARAAADRGGSDETWPQRLFRNDLPPGTVYVNLGRNGFRLADAPELDPDIAQLTPQLVIVWTGEDDVAAGITPPAFAASYAQLLGRLVAPDRRIVVATLPGVDPSYNAAITAAAAATTGATGAVNVVDLASEIDPADVAGGKLTRHGNEAVAAAFRSAIS
jgi:hypothetical protein